MISTLAQCIAFSFICHIKMSRIASAMTTQNSLLVCHTETEMFHRHSQLFSGGSFMPITLRLVVDSIKKNCHHCLFWLRHPPFIIMVIYLQFDKQCKLFQKPDVFVDNHVIMGIGEGGQGEGQMPFPHFPVLVWWGSGIALQYIIHAWGQISLEFTRMHPF